MKQETLRRTVAIQQELAVPVAACDSVYFELAAFLEDEGSRMRSPGTPIVGLTQAVLQGLLARVVKSARSIAVLLVNGLEDDAMSIERCLVDHAASALYIAKNTGEGRSNKLALRYFEYAAVERQNSEKRLQDAKADLTQIGGEATLKATDKLVKEFRARYKGRLSTWHGGTMEDIFKTIPQVAGGLKSSYKLACVATHPTWLARKLLNDERDQNFPCNASLRVNYKDLLYVGTLVAVEVFSMYLLRYYPTESTTKTTIFRLYRHLEKSIPESEYAGYLRHRKERLSRTGSNVTGD